MKLAYNIQVIHCHVCDHTSMLPVKLRKQRASNKKAQKRTKTNGQQTEQKPKKAKLTASVSELLKSVRGSFGLKVL